MRRSARLTTSTAGRGWTRRAGPVRASVRRTHSATSSATCLATSSAEGGAQGATAVFRGADLRYELALDLEQAVFGTSTEIDFQTVKECDGVRTARAPRAGTRRCTCETCSGHRPGADQPGHLRGAANLPALQGSRLDHQGSLPGLRRARTACARTSACRSRFRPASIPATASGSRARAKRAVTAVPTGDLYVEIVVREHPIFERDGAHLSCEVPVSFTTATLGGSVEVPTLEGQAMIKVPAGTQSGRVFRLREKGIKPVRGGVDRRPVLPRGRGDAGRPRLGPEGTPAQVRGLARGRRQAAQSAAAHLARGRPPVLRTHGRLT